VWRGENTQRGRYREFMQCDFDIVGTDTASADFEILLLMVRSMEALRIHEFTIQLSHRGVFNRLLERMGCSEQSVEILRLVDKLGKIGKEGVLSGLSQIVSDGNAQRILDFVCPGGSYDETLEKMADAAGGPSEDTQRLRDVRTYMEELGLAGKYVLNPAITRGLDYYTGVVFETFLDKLPGIGSVLSGGRYNDLASLYTKERIPGVGASVGLDRLMAALDELNVARTRTGTADVLVVCLDEKLVGYYHELADWLRREGISCEVYPESRKLVAQFKAAEKSGIPLGLICGEDERSDGTLTLKDFRSRENLENLSRDAFLSKARARLPAE
jgi:histidyl-tRNA synthetase